VPYLWCSEMKHMELSKINPRIKTIRLMWEHKLVANFTPLLKFLSFTLFPIKSWKAKPKGTNMNNQKTCHSSLSQCLQSYNILKVSSICQVHFCRPFIRILSWQTGSFVSMHLLHLYLIWKNLWQLHHSGFQNHHAVHSELLPFLSQNSRKMLYTLCLDKREK
jgi:hypothetical protein